MRHALRRRKALLLGMGHWVLGEAPFPYSTPHSLNPLNGARQSARQALAVRRRQAGGLGLLVRSLLLHPIALFKHERSYSLEAEGRKRERKETGKSFYSFHAHQRTSAFKFIYVATKV